jgi:rubredoxin
MLPQNLLLEKRERCAMAGTGFRSLPRENPCAQCGRLIGLPEWVETEPGRTFYLWRCMACDYRFEAVAYFDPEEADEAIAA